MKKKLFAIDLFAGCGGLTQGLADAGFEVFAAVENDVNAANVYKLNHKRTKMYLCDIKKLSASKLRKDFPSQTSPLHLIAACPPCQGFSSLRRNNRKRSAFDKRNRLILEFLRFVKVLKPLCIMLENVPGLQNYYLYKRAIRELSSAGYQLAEAVLDVADYNVPQHRERLILVGSLIRKPVLAPPSETVRTVRDQIGGLPQPTSTKDKLHRMTMEHTPRIAELIRLIPKDGGSRKALPARLQLKCHQHENAGFCDVYGRLRWDDVSVTITGGCLNPSKGRFLHPEQDRAITPREAALLQTFPRGYEFLSNEFEFPKDVLGLLIGNALPPAFTKVHSRQLAKILLEQASNTAKRKPLTSRA